MLTGQHSLNKNKLRNRIARLAVAAAVFSCTLPAPSQTPLRHSRFSPTPIGVGLALRLIDLERGALLNAHHPLFDSSYMGSENEILATTRHGNVTSRDLYLWMVMKESPHSPSLPKLLRDTRGEEAKKDLRDLLKDEIDDYVFSNMVLPSLQSARPDDSAYRFRQSLYELRGYQLTYLQRIIQPLVFLTETDYQKHLQENEDAIVAPARWRTRYIFIASDESDPYQEQNAALEQMEDARNRILSGQISFANAAREISEAPSASRGGEIPPFSPGELFFLYENSLAELQPGEVSLPFRGPRGYYMTQLIETLPAEEPSLSNPEHREIVVEQVSRKVLRETYTWELANLTRPSQRHPINRGSSWDFLEDCDVVGEVCNLKISKAEFRNVFPEVEPDGIGLRVNLVTRGIQSILEREAMAQEVRDQGFDNDPMLQRTRIMADNLARRDAFIETMGGNLNVTDNAVASFYTRNPELFTPLALKRIIRLTMLPVNTVALPAQTRLELEKALGVEPAPTYAIASEKIMDEEEGTLLYDTNTRVREAYELMQTPIDPMPEWQAITPIEDSESTDTVGFELMEAPEVDLTTDTLSPLPAPESVSSTTQETLTKSDSVPVSKPRKRGGAGPVGSAAGGSSALPPKSVGIDRSGVPPLEADSASIVPTKVQPVPVGITAPAIAPGVELKPWKGERPQQPPPATSAVPFNPDWFYERADYNELIGRVQGFSSSDFILRQEDLGFVYTEDIAGAPRLLESLPVGSFSRPIIYGRNAVSYYVQEEKTVPTPPFEEIKPHVYRTYREVLLNEQFARAYKAAVSGANIDYKF